MTAPADGLRPFSARLFKSPGVIAGRFEAMACPCEILLDTEEEPLARSLVDAAVQETRRIERKFSRYLETGIVREINQSRGRPVAVDAETADLLDYAAKAHAMSDGLFDITSGVLRRAWKFDGSDRIPTPEQVAAILPHVGWARVQWNRPVLTLPDGMEIDLGGIGKEYAVDRALKRMQEISPIGMLVNFGGDIAVGGRRKNNAPWTVGVEGVDQDGVAVRVIQVLAGGLTTSGDAKKFLLKDGKRYGHILNPRTGWPVEKAPRSVTVAAGTCSEAGLLSTLAMLHGAEAEAFLKDVGVRSWCFRS